MEGDHAVAARHMWSITQVRWPDLAVQILRLFSNLGLCAVWESWPQALCISTLQPEPTFSLGQLGRLPWEMCLGEPMGWRASEVHMAGVQPVWQPWWLVCAEYSYQSRRPWSWGGNNCPSSSGECSSGTVPEQTLRFQDGPQEQGPRVVQLSLKTTWRCQFL